MFDGKITIFDIQNLQVGKSEKSRTERLTLDSCKAIIYDKTYSELDELSFANLNHNDYGFGYIEYEFGFKESFSNPYMRFYIACFALRMNLLGYPIKVNIIGRQKGEPKYLYPNNYTKVNKYGNMALGIRYFFQDEKERYCILNSEEICIEGNISLGSKRNVYDIMCRIVKTDDNWIMEDAYTYRTHPKSHIYSFIH